MLPEIGASELLVIAIVALIVVGPKDLPMLLRRFGQFMAKLRGMASEFRASFDEMARQSELDELRKEVEAMRRGQFADIAAQAGDVEMRQAVSEIEHGLSDVGVQLHPPMSYQFAEPEVAPEPPPPKPKARAAAKPKTVAKAKPRATAKLPPKKKTAE